MYVLQIKQMSLYWEDLMIYDSVESARKAYPHFRKHTQKDIRLVRRAEEMVPLEDEQRPE
jgi:hypothetical protein